MVVGSNKSEGAAERAKRRFAMQQKRQIASGRSTNDAKHPSSVTLCLPTRKTSLQSIVDLGAPPPC